MVCMLLNVINVTKAKVTPSCCPLSAWCTTSGLFEVIRGIVFKLSVAESTYEHNSLD